MSMQYYLHVKDGKFPDGAAINTGCVADGLPIQLTNYGLACWANNPEKFCIQVEMDGNIYDISASISELSSEDLIKSQPDDGWDEEYSHEFMNLVDLEALQPKQGDHIIEFSMPSGAYDWVPSFYLMAVLIRRFDCFALDPQDGEQGQIEWIQPYLRSAETSRATWLAKHAAVTPKSNSLFTKIISMFRG
jgi:hypothetical protein